jgi:hypothetical protein
MSNDIVPHRHPINGAVKRIFANDEEIELLAMAIANGMTNKEMASLFGCSTAKIGEEKRNPIVKAVVLKFVEDRVIRVARKVDSVMEQRLLNADELDTDTLLKIRKEYLGGALRLQTQGSAKDVSTINEAMDAIESDAGFAKELQELLAKNSKK